MSRKIRMMFAASATLFAANASVAHAEDELPSDGGDSACRGMTYICVGAACSTICLPNNGGCYFVCSLTDRN